MSQWLETCMSVSIRWTWRYCCLYTARNLVSLMKSSSLTFTCWKKYLCGKSFGSRDISSISLLISCECIHEPCPLTTRNREDHIMKVGREAFSWWVNQQHRNKADKDVLNDVVGIFVTLLFTLFYVNDGRNIPGDDAAEDKLVWPLRRSSVEFYQTWSPYVACGFQLRRIPGIWTVLNFNIGGELFWNYCNCSYKNS